LKKFHQGYADGVTVLSPLLQQQDWQAAEEWTHDLKGGTSGNISAYSLYQSVTHLNDAIRQVMKDSDAHTVIEETASLLRRNSFVGMISRRRIRRSREYVTLLHLPDALRLIMPTNTGVTVVVINLLYRLKWEAEETDVEQVLADLNEVLILLCQITLMFNLVPSPNPLPEGEGLKLAASIVDSGVVELHLLLPLPLGEGWGEGI